jgi:inner membrane protein
LRVDNLTHSLVGITLAELAQPALATSAQRRVLMAGSVVAANFPDIDLAWTWITPAPLGYLLHHRGYTHTVAGLMVAAIMLPLLMHLWPAVRRLAAADRALLSGLIAANLLGHVSLDALNSYGVHPFYPFNARWFYGDAVFIFEPLLWVLLGIGAACNARARATRNAIAVLLAIIFLFLALARIVPLIAIAAIGLFGLLLLATLRGARPRRRAGAALGLTTLFVIAMAGVSRIARAEAVASANSPAELVDVILSPDPGMPVCWSAIIISEDPSTATYRTQQGTLSLAPSWFGAEQCASFRLARGRTPNDHAPGAAWREDYIQSAAALRNLDRHDCWVHAWLQFGRAPLIRGDLIVDLRFDAGLPENFTAMPIGRHEAACPPNITPWTPPRADILDTSH